MKATDVPLTLLLLLQLLHSATPFYVPQGCHVTNTKKITFSGPHYDLSVWKSEGNEYLVIFSEITNGNTGLYIYSERLVYIVRRDGMDDVRQEKLIEPPLGDGWVEVEVNFGSRLNVTIPGRLNFDIPINENDINLKEIEVAGSNLTTNCLQGPRVWRVVDGALQVLPLGGLGPHQLSLYTMTTSQPQVSVGGHHLTLVWDGHAMTTDQRFNDPLPPHTLQNMTVTCRDYSTGHLNCTLEISGLKHDLVCPKEGCYLMVSGRLSDSFLALLEYPIPSSGKESTGSTLFVFIIVSFILACILLGIAAYKLFQWNKTKKLKSVDEATVELLMKDKEIENLMQAVKGKNVNKLETLLKEEYYEDAKNFANLHITHKSSQRSRQYDAAVVEAHVRGRKEVVQMFLKQHGGEHKPTPFVLVDRVTKLFTERVERVFKATANGRYTGPTGVHTLLTSYDLPVNMMNELGHTLVHQIALAKLPHGPPAWHPDDVKHFFHTHVAYPNAIDFNGQTALHLLAAQDTNKNTSEAVWRGKTTTVAKAWQDLTGLLMELGCDPRVKDHRGNTPEDVARHYVHLDQAKLLSSVKKEKVNKNKSHLLADASKKGDTVLISNALKKHVPVLPLYADADPLDSALRNKHRDAVFLLLCAGAPVCSRAITNLTALELSQHCVGLPALLPAIVRKTLLDRLEAEHKKCNGELKVVIQHAKKTLQKGNIHSLLKPDVLQAEPEELKKLLCFAARQGMTQTCQLLGLANISFNSLPGEEKALDEAIRAGYHDTVYTLCRDLRLSPYVCQAKNNIPPRVWEDMQTRDSRTLRKICDKKEGNYGLTITEEVYKLNVILLGNTNKSNEKEKGKTNKTKNTDNQDMNEINSKVYQNPDSANVLPNVNNNKPHEVKKSKSNKKGKTKNNLVSNDDIQKALQNDKNINLLIIWSAENGLVSIIDNLLNKKYIDVNKEVHKFNKTTMLHVAAASGQVELLEYLVYSGAEFSKMLCDFTVRDVAVLRKQIDCLKYIDAYLMSERDKLKTSKKEINRYDNAFLNKIESFENQISQFSRKDTLSALCEPQPEGRAYMMLKNKGEKLGIKTFNDLVVEAEKFRNVETMDKMKVIVQEKIQLLENEMKNTDSKFTGKAELSYSPIHHCDVTSYDLINVALELQKESIQTEHLKETFFLSMEALTADADFCNKMSLVPPFVTPGKYGVILHCLLTTSNKTYMIFKVCVDPVRKLETPASYGETVFKNRNVKTADSHIYQLLFFPSKETLPFTSTFIQALMESLSYAERKALYICRFLTLFVLSPESSSRSSEVRDILRTRTLEVMFLNELSETVRDDFKQENCYERVLSILKQAVKDGKLKYGICLKYDPDQRQKKYRTSPVLDGIIRYLEEF